MFENMKTIFSRVLKLCILVATLQAGYVQAQFPFELQDVMRGNEFIGNQPENPRWSWDSKTLFFDWNPQNNPASSVYFWEAGMSSPEILPDARYAETFLCDPDQTGLTTRFYVRDNALFSFNTVTKLHTLRFQSTQRISDIQRVNNPNKVYFQQGNHFFCLDVSTGSVAQLVEFIAGEAPSEGKATFLSRQQDTLFEVVRSQKRQEEWRKSQVERLGIEKIKRIYLGTGRLSDVAISPDEAYLYYRVEHKGNHSFTDVPHFVTASGETEVEKAREKVSIANLGKYSFFQWSIALDSVLEVDFSHLSNLDRIPEYLTDSTAYPKERSIFMQRPVFSSGESRAVMDIRSLDNKDRWLVVLDPRKATVTEWDHQYDSAWIGGPGIGEWDFYPGTLGFFADGKTVYFQSEKSGFSHLYTYSVQSGEKRTLTSGMWEVRGVQVSSDRTKLYCSTNTSHPGNRDVYRYDFKQNRWDRLIDREGASELVVSPNEKQWAIRYSSSNQPWELFVSAAGKEWTQLTKSTTEVFRTYAWIKPTVITLQANDGTPVYARLYERDSARRNGAAVIFVHGAGYLQNAHRFWSNYHREYMFHHFLVEQGYTVLDIDYRGSDGYGRKFRTGIYRHMGGLDLEDQLLGRSYLIRQKGIDSTKVGIYGGSYGGFITLMALFKHPGAFQAGAALRSVTDWAHYNHPYTSNILNFPETDPLAYERSSPIYFAEHLKDHLLILHGMIDDNVQFQDVVRLSQRLIELKKTKWEMALYPVERHGFFYADSWYDEYRRIFELFEKTLR